MRVEFRFFKEVLYRCLLGTLRLLSFPVRSHSDGILIFKPDRIGDFILATGVLHLLVREFGIHNVTLMVSSIVLPLASKEFPDLRIISIPPVSDTINGGIWSGWWKTRRLNAGRRYRQLICLRHHPTLFEDLLLTCIPTDRSISVARTKWGESFWVRRLRTFTANRTMQYPSSITSGGECKELETHRLIAEAVLEREVSFAEIAPNLTSLSAAEGSYLLLLPYGSDPIRTYPEKLLVEALGVAGLPSDVSFVICGEISQTKKLNGLAEKMRQRVPNVVDLIFPPDLSSFVKVVAEARCVYAMESAGAHLATTLNKRGVFVLGGGHFGLFAPWSNSNRRSWLSQPLDCFGCDWKCSQPYVKCIHDISTATIAECFRTVWSAN